MIRALLSVCLLLAVCQAIDISLYRNHRPSTSFKPHVLK
jgi:cathepsin X